MHKVVFKYRQIHPSFLRMMLYLAVFIVLGTDIVFSQTLNTTVYICLYKGRKYHLNHNCRGLGECRVNPHISTLQDAIDGLDTNNGFTSFTYCKICANKCALLEANYRSGGASNTSSVTTSVELVPKRQQTTDAPQNKKKNSKQINIGSFKQNK